MTSAIADCQRPCGCSPTIPTRTTISVSSTLKQGEYAKAIAEFDASLKLDAEARARAATAAALRRPRSGNAAGGAADVERRRANCSRGS